MTLETDVQELVKAFETVGGGLLPIVEQLKDTTIPLETRWQAYKTLVDKDILVNNETYGHGFLDELGDNLTLYDDFYIERHQTSNFTEMYDHLMEADGSYQERLVAARDANLAKWQEAVLASGYSSFTYDW